jgi:hypothetical protein
MVYVSDGTAPQSLIDALFGVDLAGEALNSESIERLWLRCRRRAPTCTSKQVIQFVEWYSGIGRVVGKGWIQC